MGLIEKLFTVLFGAGQNVVKDTAEVFFENSENAGSRAAAMRASAMHQFAAEFAAPKRGYFDRFMDALNRLPRPLMAFGTIGLCVAAMVDPVWFAARMQGIALIPEPLWWLLGTVVSFYFGARYQVKSQEFQRSVVATMAQTPAVRANIKALEALRAGASGDGPLSTPALPGADAPNPALSDWRAGAVKNGTVGNGTVKNGIAGGRDE